MKNLIAALLLWLGLASAALAQQTDRPPLYCISTYQVNQAAVSITKIISGVSGKSIGICGYTLAGGAAVSTFTMAYGTGTNCNTGQVTLEPIVNVPINGFIMNRTSFVNMNLPSQNASAVANDVCITTTGTGPVSIVIYYLQY